MKTIYHSLKYPKRYIFLVVFFLVVLTGILLSGLIFSYQTEVFGYIQFPCVIVYILIIQIFYYSKIVIDQEHNTLNMNATVHNFKMNIKIEEITMLEIYKKKNGKIKKFLIRTTPT